MWNFHKASATEVNNNLQEEYNQWYNNKLSFLATPYQPPQRACQRTSRTDKANRAIRKHQTPQSLYRV